MVKQLPSNSPRTCSVRKNNNLKKNPAINSFSLQSSGNDDGNAKDNA